jgi:flagellar biosynthesis/type III secretory pathway chaperone
MVTTDPIIDALHAQVTCYQRLAKLAALQHEHVQQGRTEQLLEVLGHRQEVLDQLGALERVVASAKRQWTQFVASLPQTDRADAERLLAETRRLLEDITAADCNDVLVLQQRKLNVGRQINQAASARQVNRNYAAAAYGKRAPVMDVQQ